LVTRLACFRPGGWFAALLSPANSPDDPFAQPLLAWAVRLSQIRPRVIRLDAAYWGFRLIAWIPTVLGVVAVIPWHPKRQKNRSCLPLTWTRGMRQMNASLAGCFSSFPCSALLSLADPLWFGRLPSPTRPPSSSLWLLNRRGAPISSALPNAF
jgi:hypothetical protein